MVAAHKAHRRGGGARRSCIGCKVGRITGGRARDDNTDSVGCWGGKAHHWVGLPEQRLCRPELPQFDQLNNDLYRGNTNNANAGLMASWSMGTTVAHRRIGGEEGRGEYMPRLRADSSPGQERRGCGEMRTCS